MDFTLWIYSFAIINNPFNPFVTKNMRESIYIEHNIKECAVNIGEVGDLRNPLLPLHFN